MVLSVSLAACGGGGNAAEDKLLQESATIAGSSDTTTDQSTASTPPAGSGAVETETNVPVVPAATIKSFSRVAPTVRFSDPAAIASDRNGNHTIRAMTPDAVVSTLAGTAGQRGSAN